MPRLPDFCSAPWQVRVQCNQFSPTPTHTASSQLHLHTSNRRQQALLLTPSLTPLPFNRHLWLYLSANSCHSCHAARLLTTGSPLAPVLQRLSCRPPAAFVLTVSPLQAHPDIRRHAADHPNIRATPDQPNQPSQRARLYPPTNVGISGCAKQLHTNPTSHLHLACYSAGACERRGNSTSQLLLLSLDGLCSCRGASSAAQDLSATPCRMLRACRGPRPARAPMQVGGIVAPGWKGLHGCHASASKPAHAAADAHAAASAGDAGLHGDTAAARFLALLCFCVLKRSDGLRLRCRAAVNVMTSNTVVQP